MYMYKSGKLFVETLHEGIANTYMHMHMYVIDTTVCHVDVC